MCFRFEAIPKIYIDYLRVTMNRIDTLAVLSPRVRSLLITDFPDLKGLNEKEEKSLGIAMLNCTNVSELGYNQYGGGDTSVLDSILASLKQSLQHLFLHMPWIRLGPDTVERISASTRNLQILNISIGSVYDQDTLIKLLSLSQSLLEVRYWQKYPFEQEEALDYVAVFFKL